MTFLHLDSLVYSETAGVVRNHRCALPFAVVAFTNPSTGGTELVMMDSKVGFEPCPDNVAVIGGGRWARVLTEVLCGIVSPSVGISVHSTRNVEQISSWAASRGLEKRIHISPELPHFSSARSSAVIVANAARDHEKVIEWAFSAGVPVLVEKPVSLTSAATERLANLARSTDQYFAAAHIFLFARYLDKFANIVRESGNIRRIRVHWMDPQFENRHGEKKGYDPGLPVFADWLPHVSSMVGSFTPNLPLRCEKLKFIRGGAHVELELMLGDIPCSFRLVRNGDTRQRIIEVDTRQRMLQLNFSREPGTITSGSSIMNGDPDWDLEKRPAARMLTAFLQGASDGELDDRLNIEIGLRANRLIDQTFDLYRSAMMPWMIDMLVASPKEVDNDLRYALSEMLQSEGPLSPAILEQQIERVRQQFSGRDCTRLASEMASARDPSVILKAIAR